MRSSSIKLYVNVPLTGQPIFGLKSNSKSLNVSVQIKVLRKIGFFMLYEDFDENFGLLRKWLKTYIVHKR